VNCEVCGTELPHGAMFCGECGRAVGARSVARNPDSGMPVQPVAAAPVIAPRSEPVPLQRVGPPAQQPRDTVIIDPFDLEQLARVSAPPTFLVGAVPEPEPEPEPAPQVDIEQDLPPDVVAAEQAGQFPWGDRGASIFSDSDELEQTLIVPRRDQGERFVLQFSTGESVTVFGTGLLGRNPMPQPSEYFDQLVAISDPGKSVSKTHLEFGQESGSFWVSDRYSGNGSVVREPEMPPRRLIAGKRYRIVRGTRVDIGEQFFVVS
jgi:hypothetical protein